MKYKLAKVGDFYQTLNGMSVFLISMWPVCHSGNCCVVCYLDFLLPHDSAWKSHFKTYFCARRTQKHLHLQVLLSCFFLSFRYAQIEDVIDDIISLESSLNDEFMTLIESGLQLPNTVCSNILNSIEDQLSNAFIS